MKRVLFVLGAATALFLGTPGAGWASDATGLTGQVSAEGTVTVSTVAGHGSPGLRHLWAASYTLPAGWDGGWDATASPQHLFASATAVLDAGMTTVTFTVKVPTCQPFQLDVGFGTTIQKVITWPQGSKNNLKGALFKGSTHCTPSPTPTSTEPTSSSSTPSMKSTPPTSKPRPSVKSKPSLAPTGLSPLAQASWTLSLILLVTGTTLLGGSFLVTRGQRRH